MSAIAALEPIATCAHCHTQYFTVDSFLALPKIKNGRNGDNADFGGGYRGFLRDCTCKPGATFSIVFKPNGELDK